MAATAGWAQNQPAAGGATFPLSNLPESNPSADPPSSRNPSTNPSNPQAAAVTPIALTHARVVDVATGAVLENATVVTRGALIEAVSVGAAPPQGAVVVDVAGKYVIPGLWDMHTHAVDLPRDFYTLIVHGITGVRDMYSANEPAAYTLLRALPDAVRMVVPGLIDGPGRRLTPGAYVVRNAEEARLAVQLLVAQRAEFIKVYSNLSREAYFAVADESRRLGIAFAGHVPESVTPAEAAIAGQLSQEHLIDLLQACSSREDELRAERLKFLADPAIPAMAKTRGFGWPAEEGLLDSYDAEKASRLFETFVDNGVWQTPTLAISYYAAEAPVGARPMILRDGLAGDELDEFRAHVRRMLARYQQLVGDMHRAGVLLLAGTDAGPATDVPLGDSLHQELELLVGSGLTPLEALQTATRNPALYFGILTLLGSVEPGKAADIVVLDANPLENIRNTRRVDAVVMRGRLYTHDVLERLRTELGLPTLTPATAAQ